MDFKIPKKGELLKKENGETRSLLDSSGMKFGNSRKSGFKFEGVPSLKAQDAKMIRNGSGNKGPNEKGNWRNSKFIQEHRAPPLKAFRRRQSSTTSKIESKASASTFNKIYEDLPDYEDCIDDNDKGDVVEMIQYGMDCDDQISKIFKIVKDEKSFLSKSRPQVNPVYTKMDVDEELQLVHQPKKEEIFVVPDTNIWISDLRLIDRLLNQDFTKPLIIMIPWMVLQELDVKTHSKNSKLNVRRKPINYIYQLLSTKHPKVKAQRAIEAVKSKGDFDEIVADDSILGCALQLHDQRSNNDVILLSNDINLLNKAIACGLKVADSRNALEKISETTHPTRSSTACTLPSDANSTVTCSRPIPSVRSKRKFENTPSVDFAEDVEMGSLQDDIPKTKVRALGKPFHSKGSSGLKHLEAALLKAFSHIIKRKMIEDYGEDGWEYALKIKPPWDLISAIKCMLRHWLANFSYVFIGRGAEAHMETLLDFARKLQYSSFPNEPLEEKIIDCCASLWNYLSKDFQSDHEILEVKNLLMLSLNS